MPEDTATGSSSVMRYAGLLMPCCFPRKRRASWTNCPSSVPGSRRSASSKAAACWKRRRAASHHPGGSSPLRREDIHAWEAAQDIKLIRDSGEAIK